MARFRVERHGPLDASTCVGVAVIGAESGPSPLLVLLELAVLGHVMPAPVGPQDLCGIWQLDHSPSSGTMRSATLLASRPAQWITERSVDCSRWRRPSTVRTA